MQIKNELKIEQDISKDALFNVLLNKIHNKQIDEVFQEFTTHVPYRFLSPWIPYVNNFETIEASIRFENNCIYAILDGEIEINPLWMEYLLNNSNLLLEFTVNELCVFTKRKNPALSDIRKQLYR